MLNKFAPGKSAIRYHKKKLDPSLGKATISEKVFGNTIIRAPKKNPFMSTHYTEFAGKPNDVLKFWGSEVIGNRAMKRNSTPRRLKRLQKTLDVFLKEVKEKGLENVTKPESRAMLKLYRAEKNTPGNKTYPAIVATMGAAGLGGTALAADGFRKLAKENKKKDKPVAFPAAVAAGSLATPTIREKYLQQFQNNIDPKSNKLVVVTEGGKHNPGGGGHAAVAKSLVEEHEKLNGKGSAKAINFTDYSRFRNKYLSKFNKSRYDTMTAPSTPSPKRYRNYLGFVLGMGPMRNTQKRKLQKELKGAGRVIVTQPDATNFIKPMGIKPEMVMTDYGVDTPGSKGFWYSSFGLDGKDKKSISRIYTPSAEAKGIFSHVNIPMTDIPSVPISSKFMKTPKKRRAKLKEIQMFDNKGNATGKKVKLDPKKKLIAVTGGTTGFDVDEVTRQLAESGRKDIQVIGISGKNENVRKNMSKYKGVIAQGFEKNYEKVIDSADVVLARPHGISTTEAIAKGKPVLPVVTNRVKDSYAPHMVGNAKHFSKVQGTPTVILDEKDSLKSSLSEVLDNLDNYKSKANDASKVIRENAAKKIISDTSVTTNRLYKMPKYLKLPFYGAAAGWGGVAAYNAFKNSGK